MGSPPLALVRQPSWDEALPLVQDEPPPVADPDDSAGVDAGDHVLPLPSLPDLSHRCLSALLPPLQADVRSPLQRAPVRKKLLGAPRPVCTDLPSIKNFLDLSSLADYRWSDEDNTV